MGLGATLDQPATRNNDYRTDDGAERRSRDVVIPTLVQEPESSTHHESGREAVCDSEQAPVWMTYDQERQRTSARCDRRPERGHSDDEKVHAANSSGRRGSPAR